MFLTESQEHVIQGALTHAPLCDHTFCLKSCDLGKNHTQVDSMLRMNPNSNAHSIHLVHRQVQFLLHILQVVIDLCLHVRLLVLNLRTEPERQQEAPTPHLALLLSLSVLVLQVHLGAEALQPVTRQNRNARAQHVRLLHRVRRQQNRHLRLHPLDRAPDLATTLGIQPSLCLTPLPRAHRRLVQEHDLRVTHHRHRQ